MKYDQTAEQVLRGVGGEGNVASLVHCATRLRFTLKDASKANKDAVERAPGVITVVESGGQFQVVIGNDVPLAYEEIGKISRLTQQESGHVAATGNIFNRFVELISSIFQPILWPLAGTGLLKALLALVVQLGWMDTATSTYTILNAASDALINFLPMVLAITAAKRFNANQFVSLAIAGALVYPAIIDLNALGEPVDFFGIPVVMVSYVSSVIPIIVAVWVQGHLERFFKKVLPSVVRNFLTPMLVILILVPLTLLTIGPATTFVGNGISGGIEWLWNLTPAIGGVLMGGLWQVFVIFGLHWAFVPIITNDLAVSGYSLLTGPLFAAVLAQAAAAFGVFFRTRNSSMRQLAGSSSLSGFLAGITEPAIYGVTLRLKKPFIYGVIGGAVGGGIAAAGGSAVEGFVLPGAITITSTMGVGNFAMQLLGTGIAMAIAFTLTVTLGFTDVPEDSTASSAPPAGDNTVITTPVAGDVVALKDVPDKVFSGGALGAGAAVHPRDNTLSAPVSGTLVTVMPHAFGIHTDTGVDVLIHVGIDTVQLNGKHFTTAVTQGQRINTGDTLTVIDRTAIAEAGFSPLTVVLITNPAAVGEVEVAQPGAIEQGEPLLTVASVKTPTPA